MEMSLPIFCEKRQSLSHSYAVIHQNTMKLTGSGIYMVGITCNRIEFFTFCGSPPGVMMAGTLSFNAKIGLVDF